MTFIREGTNLTTMLGVQIIQSKTYSFYIPRDTNYRNYIFFGKLLIGTIMILT